MGKGLLGWGLFGEVGLGERDELRNLCVVAAESNWSQAVERGQRWGFYMCRGYTGTTSMDKLMWWGVLTTDWTYRMWKLWSLSWVSDWQRPSAAATSGSRWIKAKPLGLSSQNHGKLPTCPGTLGIRVTLM